MKKDSKFLSVLTSLLLAVALITGAVAVPILWRGFYYGQIDSLALPAQTGFSPDIIREAFDEVMDYLVFDGEFGTGALRWSESGMAHFADCKVLFRVDFLVLALSLVMLGLVALLCRLGKKRLHPFLGRGPCFWAFTGMLAVLGLFGIWALLDFDSLFTVFHLVFFPGKTNWTFDPRLDQIILILPEAFWARAAALVAGLALGGGLLLAIAEGLLRRKKVLTVYEELKDLGK